MDVREPVRYQLGDIVRMKKEHPCGSAFWEVTRTGMDFGLRCLGCGRKVMIPRRKFERLARAIVTREEADAALALRQKKSGRAPSRKAPAARKG